MGDVTVDPNDDDTLLKVVDKVLDCGVTLLDDCMALDEGVDETPDVVAATLEEGTEYAAADEDVATAAADELAAPDEDVAGAAAANELELRAA